MENILTTQSAIAEDRPRKDRMAIVRTALTILLCLLFAALAIGYVFGPDPPFGFYYDLGVNIAATQLMDASMKSLTDFKDALGWASWDNAPQFTFNPMLSYAFLVPLAKIFAHDAMRAVKALQVIDTLIAFFGMSFLYSTVRRRSSWAAVAGGLYAILPLTVLQIQGNVEFGLATALAPLALALCFRITTSSGPAGLPLCGAICSLAGACIAIEYFFFLTLPIYVTAALAAYQRRTRWLVWSAVGLIVTVAAVSYCIFPTLGTRAFFSDPVQRMTSLQSGQYVLFSGTLLSMASLVLNEALVANPPFNIFNDVGWALFPGVTLWICAAAYITRNAARRSLTVWECALLWVCLLCVLLALGATLPFGSIVWNWMSHTPVLAYMRTPDRFLALPAVCIVLFATFLGEGVVRRSYVGFLAPVVIVAVSFSLVIFGYLRHALQTEPSLSYREPNLTAINARVAALGGRNVPLAFVRNGSIYDFPLYGYSTPQLRTSSDLAGRYLLDGIAGAGIFAKAGVHSLVATPNWTTDGQKLPNPLSALSHSALLTGEMIGANSVYLFVPRGIRAPIYPVHPSCYEGGPGNLDRIEAMPRLRNISVMRSQAVCERTILSDFDPRDSLVNDPTVQRWPGNVLFPDAVQIKDNDYAFIQGRALLNDPWYRNAIDGDATVLSRGGAVEIKSGASATIRSHIIKGVKYALDVRVACHADATVSVKDSSHRLSRVQCHSAPGFQWLTVPLVSSTTDKLLTISIEPATPVLRNDAQWVVALDGVVLAPQAHEENTALKHAGKLTAVLSTARFAPLGLTPSPGTGSISLVKRIGFVEGVGASAATSSAPALTVSSTNNSLVFRWNGESGAYVVSGAAWIAGKAATLQLQVKDRSVRAISAYDPALDIPTTVTAITRLRKGDLLNFKIDLPAGDPNATGSFVGVNVMPVMPGTISVDESGSENYSWNFLDVPSWFVKSADNQQSSSGLVPGAPIDITLTAPRFTNQGTQVSAQINATGAGSGSATLACAGARPVTFVLRSPDSVAGTAGSQISSCKLHLHLGDRALRIGTVDITTHGPVTGARVTTRWLTKGAYLVRAFTAAGVQFSPALEIDGRKAGKTAVINKTGWHTLLLRSATTFPSTLAFEEAPSENRSLPKVTAVQVAAARWQVGVKNRSTLEASVFPDGYWTLASAHATYSGKRCDLVNTCFESVEAGEYTLLHRWSPWSVFGIMASIAVWAFAIACAAGLYTRRRDRES